VVWKRTLFGGQSESLGKTMVKRMAPQRQPPETLSGRAVVAMEGSVLDELLLESTRVRVAE